MTPLPTPSAMAGSGRVNATALDAVIRQITTKINALIAALGVARGEDRQLADKSIQPRMIGPRVRGALEEMIDFVAAIRRQYLPGDMCPKGFGTGQIWAGLLLAFGVPNRSLSFTAPPAPANKTGPLVYRIHARIRLSGQAPMYVQMWTPVRGTVTLNGTTLVAGLATYFSYGDPTNSGDLTMGTLPCRVRINGEIRNLVSIDSDTQITIDRPFSFTGSALSMESDAILGRDMPAPMNPAVAMMVGILRAYPAGSFPYRPGVFGVIADDDAHDVIMVRRRESLEIVTSAPLRRIVLQSSLAPDPLRGVIEADMAVRHADYEIDFLVEPGATITLLNGTDDNVAAWTLDSTGFPADDDPRFPRVIAFPCLPSVQIDILAVEQWQEDDTVLETEAGFPINGEAPSGALRI